MSDPARPRGGGLATRDEGVRFGMSAVLVGLVGVLTLLPVVAPALAPTPEAPEPANGTGLAVPIERSGGGEDARACAVTSDSEPAVRGR